MDPSPCECNKVGVPWGKERSLTHVQAEACETAGKMALFCPQPHCCPSVVRSRVAVSLLPDAVKVFISVVSAVFMGD